MLADAAGRGHALALGALRRIDHLPLYFILPYLFGTLALFFLGPYVWPLHEQWVPAVYVPACFFALAVGFRLGSSGTARGAGMPWGLRFFYLGAFATLALLIPLALVYTGKLPWEVASALKDQREAYSALGAQIAETTGKRGPLVLARGLAGPFILCVLPMTALFWQRLSILQRSLGIATALAYVDLSILRGTTAPLADITVLIASGVLVRIGLAAQGRGLASIFRHWKVAAVILLIGAVVVMTLVGRVEARLGGKKIDCLANSGACVDLTSGFYSKLSDTAAFGAAAVAGYFSQGYYGLSLAAEKPFIPTWGIGHSPIVGALYVQLGGDENFVNRTYTYRARWDGWSDETQWSTLMAWLANDVSLWGVPFLIWGLGWLLGRTWIDATRGRDLRAAIFFSLLMMVVFYMPANGYMFASIDTYTAFVFWWVVWGVGRRRREAAQASPTTFSTQ